MQRQMQVPRKQIIASAGGGIGPNSTKQGLLGRKPKVPGTWKSCVRRPGIDLCRIGGNERPQSVTSLHGSNLSSLVTSEAILLDAYDRAIVSMRTSFSRTMGS